MASDKRLSARFGADTSDFKSGIAEINRELRVTESGFRAAASTMGDWGNSANGLHTRMEALTKEIELQKNKVALVRAEYERVKSEQGANSVAAKNLEIRLNGEQAALGKMQAELKGTTKDLKDLKGHSEAAEKAVQTLASAAKIGAGLVVAGIGALTGAVVGGLKAVEDWGNTVDDVGDVLGTTAEDSSTLAVAIKGLGGDIGAFTGQVSFLAKGLEDADGKVGATGKVLEKLGISFRDANGEILPTTDILKAVADRVNAMPDGLEKTRLLMQLFGKSGKTLQDAMKELGTEGFAAAEAKAKLYGLSMSGEASEGAIKFKRSIADLKLMAQGMAVTFGSELLPEVQPLVDEFRRWAVKELPTLKKELKSLVAFIKTDFIPQIGGLFNFLNDKLNVAVDSWSYNYSMLITGFGLWGTIAKKSTFDLADFDVAVEDGINLLSEMGKEIDAAKNSSGFFATTLLDLKVAHDLVYTATDQNIQNAELYSTSLAGMITSTDDATKSTDALTLSNQEMFDSINLGLDTTISNWIEKMDFMLAGGGELQAAMEKVKSDWAANKITDTEAKDWMRSLFVQTEILNVEIGKISPKEAYEKIAAEFHTSIDDAKAIFDSTKSDMEKGIKVPVTWTYSGPPLAYSGPPGSTQKPKQSGGDVRAGEAYIVGELRPELFVPGVSGTIIPNIANLVRLLDRSRSAVTSDPTVKRLAQISADTLLTIREFVSSASGGNLAPQKVEISMSIQGGTGKEKEESQAGLMAAARQLGWIV